MKISFSFWKSLLTAIILGMNLTSNAIEINGLNYFLNSDKHTAYITSDQSASLSGTVIIPNTVTFANMTFTIDSIADSAFSNCVSVISFDVSNNFYFSIEDGILFNANKTKLILCPRGAKKTSYAIPNSITTIGNYAFYLCTIDSITIGNSVVTIGDRAFGGCPLNSVIIGNSVTTIGDGAFWNCTLTFASIGNSVKTIGSRAFQSCQFKNITIPNSVTTIKDFAFGWCLNLKTIDISKSITFIGYGAFTATGLTTINIPNSIQETGVFMCESCIYLTSVTLGSSLSKIGDWDFARCPLLSEVHCQAIIPPECYNTSFYNTKYQSGILYVPKGCKSSYATVSPWKDFMMIIEEENTATSTLFNNSLKIHYQGSNIVITGAELGEDILIYKINGSIIKRLKVTSETMQVLVPSSAVYFIKVKDQIVKIVK
jgi:hypothetical protein